MALTQSIRRVSTYLPWDGREPRFEAWTDGQTWNGWECPRFEKPAADNVIAYINVWNPQPQGSAYYDREKDTYYTPDENEPESWDEWPGLDWNGVHVYAIGAFSWTWDAND